MGIAKLHSQQPTSPGLGKLRSCMSMGSSLVGLGRYRQRVARICSKVRRREHGLQHRRANPLGRYVKRCSRANSEQKLPGFGTEAGGIHTKKNTQNRTLLLAWNAAALVLVVFVIMALLSLLTGAPTTAAR